MSACLDEINDFTSQNFSLNKNSCVGQSVHPRQFLMVSTTDRQTDSRNTHGADIKILRAGTCSLLAPFFARDFTPVQARTWLTVHQCSTHVACYALGRVVSTNEAADCIKTSTSANRTSKSKCDFTPICSLLVVCPTAR